MGEWTYWADMGGLPPQTQLMEPRARFTESYAVIPRVCHSDITASLLPFWEGARVWILARPLSGFAETFSQYLVELAPGGGSDRPETEEEAQAALFVLSGEMTVHCRGEDHRLAAGGFAYLPAGEAWTCRAGGAGAKFVWVRKAFEAVEGLDAPEPVFTSDREVAPSVMPDCEGVWATTRFMDPSDIRYDFHVTIVTLQPGAVIPFPETHVMEHGLLVLQGKGVYRLNQDWVEVEAGDFMWLRAFCPQSCYAGGPEPFRYLLYKDVNRHPGL